MGALDWFREAWPGLLWAMLVTVVVSVVVSLLSLGGPNIKGDWVTLRPTLFLYGIGILAIPLSVLFLTFGILGLLYSSMPDWGPHPKLIAASGVLMGFMFPYCAATTFCVRVRFNDSGVEKSWFGRPTFITWAEIKNINRSVFLGPLLITNLGRRVMISEYLLGFPDLLAKADAMGVVVADDFRS